MALDGWITEHLLPAVIIPSQFVLSYYHLFIVLERLYHCPLVKSPVGLSTPDCYYHQEVQRRLQFSTFIISIFLDGFSSGHFQR